MNKMGKCLSREQSNGEILDTEGFVALGNVVSPLDEGVQCTTSEQRVSASTSPQNVSDKQRRWLDFNEARTSQMGDKGNRAKECRNEAGSSAGEIEADKQQTSEDSLRDHPQATDFEVHILEQSQFLRLGQLQEKLTEKATNTPELGTLVKELSDFKWAPLAEFLCADDYHYNVFEQDVFDCIERHRKRTEADLRELYSEWMKVGKLIDHLKNKWDS